MVDAIFVKEIIEQHPHNHRKRVPAILNKKRFCEGDPQIVFKVDVFLREPWEKLFWGNGQLQLGNRGFNEGIIGVSLQDIFEEEPQEVGEHVSAFLLIDDPSIVSIFSLDLFRLFIILVYYLDICQCFDYNWAVLFRKHDFWALLALVTLLIVKIWFRCNSWKVLKILCWLEKLR